MIPVKENIETREMSLYSFGVTKCYEIGKSHIFIPSMRQEKRPCGPCKFRPIVDARRFAVTNLAILFHQKIMPR